MSEVALRTTVRDRAAFKSAPIDVDLMGPDETVWLRHDLGQRLGHLVIAATGPIQTWEVASPDPYRVLGLRSSLAMSVRIVLV